MFQTIFSNAIAKIKGGKEYPDIKGMVYFRNTRDGVLVTAKIYGLPQRSGLCSGNFFGFHIHEGNSCTGDNEDEFKNTKSHYNPNNCIHPFHVGDLPPLLENKGYSYMSVLTSKFKLEDIIGKTVVIHDMPDDFRTQPSRKFRKENSLWNNRKIELSIRLDSSIFIILAFFFIHYWNKN